MGCLGGGWLAGSLARSPCCTSTAPHEEDAVTSLVEPARKPNLTPQLERLPELDADMSPRLRAPARVQHHPQDAAGLPRRLEHHAFVRPQFQRAGDVFVAPVEMRRDQNPRRPFGPAVYARLAR
jgi:hypothetical protein